MVATSAFTHVTQWLAWLEAQHPPEKIDLGLQRVSQVTATLLHNKSIAQTVITVAGTNGKGSSIAYLGAILESANISYASLTSPHFISFNERICCNGQAVSDEALFDSFVRVNAARIAAANSPIPLTFFEFNALLAFDLMTVWQPEVALLEIGLGGRLDAVNVIDPDIAIVTNIALDHQDWLGSDLEIIGHAKAGIFRANKVAIFGQQDGPSSVPDYAHAIGAKLYHNGHKFKQVGNQWQGVDGTQVACQLTIPKVELPPQNVAAVVQAIKLLPQKITNQAIVQGLQNARLVGRMHSLEYQGRTIILDVAHNPAAAQHLVGQIQQLQDQTTHCVLGILSDKDYAQVLKSLDVCVDVWHLASLGGERGLSSDHLGTVVETFANNLNTMFTYDAVIDAFNDAIHASEKGDRILVCGSFHTVGDVLRHLCTDFSADLL